MKYTRYDGHTFLIESQQGITVHVSGGKKKLRYEFDSRFCCHMCHIKNNSSVKRLTNNS